MPQVTLSLRRVLELLPNPISSNVLRELLFTSKAEVSRLEGDELAVDVTPDRLDLLCEGGLALFLQGALEVETGLPHVAIRPSSKNAELHVDPSVEPLRPAIAGVLVAAPSDTGVDPGLLEEVIRYQEILHATVGRDRRLASLGVYPWERLFPPISYRLEPIDTISLVPLDGSEEVSGRSFFDLHPLAKKYGSLGRSGDRCLTLRDSKGTVLSLPPVLNTRTGGEVRPGDRTLLLESTGTRPSRVIESLSLLLLVFVARGYSVTPVTVRYHDRSDNGLSVFSPRSVHLPGNLLPAILGMNLSGGEIEHLIGRVRLSARPHSNGWRVELPAWRPDLLTATDVAEEVILARGLRPEEGILPPSWTRGKRRAESEFRHRVSELLLGLGYSLLYTPVLVSETTVTDVSPSEALVVANPVSEQFARLRNSLLPSLVDVLGHNVRHGYPQQFAEVGPVIVRDATQESGARTAYHAGAFLASESAGFADAAALVDYLLRGFDALGVREPTELPGTIPGRAARVRIAGDVVAELGELHPRILSSRKVPVPAAWAEVDLSMLWPLVRRRATD